MPSCALMQVACDIPLWASIGGQDVDRLPSASTCYNTLKVLPAGLDPFLSANVSGNKVINVNAVVVLLSYFCPFAAANLQTSQHFES